MPESSSTASSGALGNERKRPPGAEARINSGDRIVFRVEGGTVFFIDVVKHDDIGRYGWRPRRIGP